MAGPVFDPRPDPTGTRVAYVSGAALCVASLDGTWRAVAGGHGDEASATVSWGRAEFIAAEEMHRFRGFWWSPDGTTLAAARVDTAPVGRVHIADPSEPVRPAVEHAYPSAGTPNADVSLHLINLTSGRVIDVEWDRERFPYLTEVHWSAPGLLIATQTRDQRAVEVSAVDTTTGATTQRWADRDDAWVELVPGVPCYGPGGALLTCTDFGGARRLAVDGVPVTPTDLQVRAVVAAGADGIVFLANPLDDATVLHVWRATPRWCVRGAHRRARRARARPPVVRRSWCAPPPSASRRRRGTRSTASRCSRSPPCPTSRTASRSRSTACDASPPRSCCPSTTTARGRCRCSSTPTVAPTPCAPCARTSPTSRRSGSPTRASPSSSTDGRGTPGPGHGLGAGGAPRPRQRRARGPGGRPRAGGGRASLPRSRPRRHTRLVASAAISPPSPCCCDPTASTPPSPELP